MRCHRESIFFCPFYVDVCFQRHDKPHKQIDSISAVTVICFQLSKPHSRLLVPSFCVPISRNSARNIWRRKNGSYLSTNTACYASVLGVYLIRQDGDSLTLMKRNVSGCLNIVFVIWWLKRRNYCRFVPPKRARVYWQIVDGCLEMWVEFALLENVQETSYWCKLEYVRRFRVNWSIINWGFRLGTNVNSISQE